MPSRGAKKDQAASTAADQSTASTITVNMADLNAAGHVVRNARLDWVTSAQTPVPPQKSSRADFAAAERRRPRTDEDSGELARHDPVEAGGAYHGVLLQAPAPSWFRRQPNAEPSAPTQDLTAAAAAAGQPCNAVRVLASNTSGNVAVTLVSASWLAALEKPPLGDKRGVFTASDAAGVELWQVLPPTALNAEPLVLPLARLTVANPTFAPPAGLRLPLGSSIALVSTPIRIPREEPPGPSGTGSADGNTAADGTSNNKSAMRTMWCRKTAWPTELLFRASEPWADGAASSTKSKNAPKLETFRFDVRRAEKTQRRNATNDGNGAVVSCDFVSA